MEDFQFQCGNFKENEVVDAGQRLYYINLKVEKFNIKATPEHLGKVRSAYLSILDENNLIYINGMQPIENIFGEVIEKIEEFRKKNERKF